MARALGDSSLAERQEEQSLAGEGLTLAPLIGRNGYADDRLMAFMRHAGSASSKACP